MSNAKSKSTKNAGKSSEASNRLKARREARQGNRGNSDPADWKSVDPDLMCGLVAVFTAHGGVISFGYTRDGGAYRIGYFADGQSDTVYIRPTEDIDAELEAEIESWKF